MLTLSLLLSMKKVLVNIYANYCADVHRDHLVKTDCRDTQDREEKLYVTFHFNTHQNEDTALIYTSFIRVSRFLPDQVHSLTS